MAEAAVLASLGWLVAPGITKLFNKAYDYLGTGIDERREKLAAVVLPRLSLAIEKIEKSPNKDKLVDWLNRLKNAYYEAEQAIDLFKYKQLKQKVKNERGTRVSLSSQCVPRHPLIKLKYGLSIFSRQKIMLKDCIDKLIEIAKEANEFGDLLEVQENASSNTDRDTGSRPPPVIFGREKDKEKIVGLLMNEQEKIVGLLTNEPVNFKPRVSNTRQITPIVAITGRSGVGKTALAQYVFKHMIGQMHFDLHLWVHTPHKFKAIYVMKDTMRIIKAKQGALSDCNFDSVTSLQALSTQLKSMLMLKKVLLVLDDFWTDVEHFKDEWKNFIDCLSSCLSGSKILLTTQSKNVAQQVGLPGVTEVEAYNLEDIEEGQFLELFMHYAWPSNSNLQKEEFEKLGRKIAIKLKRDPGAAKIVGDQLRQKLNLSDWKEAAETDWSEDNMQPKIWSYQQLRPEFQRCFSICGLFPKGSILQRQCLIHLWMAEGFIRATRKQKRLEKIGEEYLHELVSSYFLEEVVFKEEICYRLHDLLHDLAERVQGEDFIRIDLTNYREVLSHITPMLSRRKNIRHIYLPASMIKALKEILCLMDNICTFWVESDGFVPKKELGEILKSLKKLRVLHISECVDDLPDFIGNLKHLRYLDVYRSRPLKRLPDSICKLYHLQTLVLPNCESLPNNFSELISLRRIETVGETTSHICNAGRLTSLQGLDQFVVRKKRGSELHQLENLNQLRGEFCITGLENVGIIMDARKASIKKKIHLEKLEFEWKLDQSDTDNVTDLSNQHVQLLNALQPHSYISALTLSGFGGYELPNWLLSRNSLMNLTSLTLFYCEKVQYISSINESLPNCTSLILRGLMNLKKLPSLPPNLTYLEMDQIPQVNYFSEDDLLMKEETKQSKLEVVKEIVECLKLMYLREPLKVDMTVRYFLQFVKERFEAAPELCITSSQYGNICSEIVKYHPYTDDYSRDQLLDVWKMFMHYHIETMFNKNEESNLVLPSSLTNLEISSCSITSDALSNCIQCLVSLSILKLSNILTITSLPPKEVLRLLKKLQSLTIGGCYFLSSLGGIGALTSLIELELKDCLNLSTSNEALPSSLERLIFWDCSNVDVILSKSNLPVLRVLHVWDILFKDRMGVLEVGHMSRLEELHITRWNGRLEGLNSLTALYRLLVTHCPEINPSSSMGKYASPLQHVIVDNLLQLNLILSNESIPSIEILLISSFQGDSSDDEVLQSLTSLRGLKLTECNSTHLPKNLKNLASLQFLSLDRCPNLCKLEELPMNLSVLQIKDCPKLCELKELPRNLRELQITNCPTLTNKFNKDGRYGVQFNDEGSAIVTFPIEGK
ncbi:putative disease resistance RPP13-like protein 1 [Carex rostrata]